MRHSFLVLAAAVAGLSACTGLTGPVIMGGDAAAIYLTKPDKPQPPDLANQIPPHQSWCYQTAGYPECYSHPQNVMADRLINVDPPTAYPLDADAYNKALAAKPAIAAVPEPQQPVMVSMPTQDMQVEKADLKSEIENSGDAVSVNTPSEPADPAMAMPQPIVPPPVRQEP